MGMGEIEEYNCGTLVRLFVTKSFINIILFPIIVFLNNIVFGLYNLKEINDLPGLA